jgi:hypothetical protein
LSEIQFGFYFMGKFNQQILKNLPGASNFKRDIFKCINCYH